MFFHLHVDINREIIKGLDDFMTFYNKGDFDKLRNLYIDKCEVSPPGQPMASGKDGK